MEAGVDWAEHWAELDRRLRALRPLAMRFEGTSAFFDEFLEHNEFEVALHVLCDRLIEANEVIATPEQVLEIESLHHRMELQDDCVANLKSKHESSDDARNR